MEKKIPCMVNCKIKIKVFTKSVKKFHSFYENNCFLWDTLSHSSLVHHVIHVILIKIIWEMVSDHSQVCVQLECTVVVYPTKHGHANFP